MSEKTYLGDSVYATFDGYHIILTTENGMPDDPSNRIALEPAVLASLSAYKRECFNEQEPSESDAVEYFPEIVKSNLSYINAFNKNIRKHGKAYQEVIDALSGIELNSASPDQIDLNISIAGTKQDLEAAWGVLRRLGFDAPDERPAANQPEFTGTFRRPDDKCSVYLRFSSTVCKRIQTGTRTEEVPIYEIVCD